MNRPLRAAAIAALALSLVACDQAEWVVEDAPRLETVDAAKLNEPLPLRVHVPAAIEPLSVEIVDSALGEDLLIASATRDGAHYAAEWLVTDDEAGLYRLRAKITTRDGRVVTSDEVSLWAGPPVLESALTAPQPPSNLTAAAGDARVQLSWAAAASAHGYRVYRSTAAGVPVTSAPIATVTGSTSYLDTALQNGVRYHYVVTAYSKKGRRTYASAPSNEVSAVPQAQVVVDVTPPSVQITSPVSGTSFSAAQTVTLTASAADASGIARVEFLRNGAVVSQDASAPFEASWSVDAQSNGVHAWTARAFDGAGNSATSATVSLTVSIAPPLDTTPPSVSLTAPAQDTTYGTAQTVALAATAADASGVARVEFLRNGALHSTDTTAADGFTGSFAVSAANNGSHVFTARAFDAAGNSATSAARTLTVDVATPPSAPTGVSAAAGDARVTVSWSPVAGATSYSIHWATSSGVTPASGNLIANATSPFVHGGLANGLTYFYVVTASNSAGRSPASAQVSATPVAPVDATAPSFAGLASATAVSGTQINLAWAPATDNVTAQGAIVYDIYRSSSSSIAFTSPTYTSVAGATSFAVTGLAAGSTYYFAVRARDAAGNRDANTVQRSATTPVDIRALEDRVLVLVNQKRAAGATCGATWFGPVAALGMNENLRTAARLHSQDMADQNYFSHTSLDGRSFSTRMSQAGYSGPYPWGENIAAGYSTPEAVVSGWMASEGHCRNIMSGSFRVLGVGYGFNASSSYRYYWTQDFGGG